MERTYNLYLPKSVSTKDVMNFIEERGINNSGGDPIGEFEKDNIYQKSITVKISVIQKGD